MDEQSLVHNPRIENPCPRSAISVSNSIAPFCDLCHRNALSTASLSMSAGFFKRLLPGLALVIGGTVSGALIGQPAATGATAQCPDPRSAFELPDTPDRGHLPLWVTADYWDIEQRVSRFRGSVKLERGDQLLLTERLDYDADSGRISMPQPMQYRDQNFSLSAGTADYNLADESGQFSAARYGISGGLGNGKAEQVQLQNAVLDLGGVSYTTCEGDNPDWQLEADRIVLDQSTGRGSARGAKLKFKGVPLLYSPWFSFPLDDRRKSGLLYPSIGSANDNGFDLSIPYYWNIAPQQDATFTPRLITDRGVMLGTQYRWLTGKTRGQVEVDFLPDDDELNDNRYRYQVDHIVRWSPQWQSSLHLERVSDNAYFEDFGQGLAQTSRQYLRSQAQLLGRGRYWTFDVTADDFQVIDQAVGPLQEPYSRFPRFGYRLDAPIGRSLWDVRLDSELVYFDRTEGVTGARFDLYPRLIGNYEWAAGFVRPSVGYRSTRYSLDRLAGFSDDSPSRSTPIVSLDSGLFFDRSLKSGALQTLEPRLYYLYVPFENQDDLPDFDTSELTFGFSQLFHHNRFAGADRQADANQLTLALSSRILDPSSGREQFSLNVGQIVFFTDQRVQLNSSQPPTDRDRSAFLAEINYQATSQLSTRFGIQWDWDESQIDVGYAGLAYRNRKNWEWAFDYRFRRDRVEQADIRASFPLRSNWRLIGRLNFDLENSDVQEALAGFEYNSCCWALRLLGRRYLKNRQGESRNAIYLELELTGLGSIGRRPFPLLQPDRYQP